MRIPEIQLLNMRGRLALRMRVSHQEIMIDQTLRENGAVYITVRWTGYELRRYVAGCTVADPSALCASLDRTVGDFLEHVRLNPPDPNIFHNNRAEAELRRAAQSQVRALLLTPDQIESLRCRIAVRLHVAADAVCASQRHYDDGDIHIMLEYGSVALHKRMAQSLVRETTLLYLYFDSIAAEFAEKVRAVAGEVGINPVMFHNTQLAAEEAQRLGVNLTGPGTESWQEVSESLAALRSRVANLGGPGAMSEAVASAQRTRLGGPEVAAAHYYVAADGDVRSHHPLQGWADSIAEINEAGQRLATVGNPASENSFSQEVDSDSGRGYYSNHRGDDAAETPPRRNLKMNAVRKFNQGRKFGVEMEISSMDSTFDLAAMITAAGIECRSEEYGHNTPTGWKITTDSSVKGSNGGYGMEVVSPPLAGKKGLDEIKAVCKVLVANGCKVNKSCGLHVHHDASDFTGAAPFINLIKLYGRLEARLDASMPASRRDSVNIYCKSVLARLTNRNYSGTTGAELLDRCTTPSQVRNWLDTDRYHKVNLECFWRQGTVEFRHHAGTIDVEKIVNWVVLTQVIVETAVANESVEFAVVEGEKIGKVLGLTSKWGTNDAYVKAAIMHIKKRIERLAAGVAA